MDPSLCAKGCGFFGNPATKNFCSKCYNDYLKENMVVDLDTIMLTQPPDTIVAASSYLDIPDAHPASPADAKKIEDSVSALSASVCSRVGKKLTRCHTCNKKVGLLGFTCRCGGMFCGAHRYAEEHCCSFYIKAFERQKLAANNPVISGEKLANKV